MTHYIFIFLVLSIRSKLTLSGNVFWGF